MRGRSWRTWRCRRAGPTGANSSPRCCGATALTSRRATACGRRSSRSAGLSPAPVPVTGALRPTRSGSRQRRGSTSPVRAARRRHPRRGVSRGRALPRRPPPGVRRSRSRLRRLDGDGARASTRGGGGARPRLARRLRRRAGDAAACAPERRSAARAGSAPGERAPGAHAPARERGAACGRPPPVPCCASVLERELGVEPDAETGELYREIVRHQPPPQRWPVRVPHRGALVRRRGEPTAWPPVSRARGPASAAWSR